MERSHDSSPLDDNEAAPVLVIDGLYITDAQGWSFVTSSPHLADEVTLAVKIGKAVQQYFEDGKDMSGVLQHEVIRATLDTADSRMLNTAILLLKKHWLFGEEFYEIYSSSR